MEEKFLLSVFHPDEAKSYLFETYIDLKKWRKKEKTYRSK